MTEGRQQAIRWLELAILGFFTAEYALRPLTYAFSFYGLIDLAAIAVDVDGEQVWLLVAYGIEGGGCLRSGMVPDLGIPTSGNGKS